MLKAWLIKIFFGKRILLENILAELRNLHYHLARMEAFYTIVNKIKEDDKKIIIGDIIIDKDQEIGKK